MKKTKGNKGLLDQSRFAQAERERIRRLRGLTMKEGIRLAEEMFRRVTPDDIEESKRNHPICLKLALQRMRRAAQQRRRRAVLKKARSHK